MPNVIVATTVSAELEVLAVELASLGHLVQYVHPFLYKGEYHYRLLTALPGVGDRAKRLLRKRRAPADIPLKLITNAAPFAELVRVGSGEVLPHSVRRLLLETRNKKVATTAGTVLRADLIIASSGPARRLFGARPNAFKILNLPTVHPELRMEILRKEATRYPDLEWSMRGDFPPASARHGFRAEAKLADLILVGSEFARQSLTQRGVPESKVAVIPYGTRTASRKVVRGDESSFRVLYVGRLTQAKGLRYLLDAFDSSGIEAELRIVGGSAGQAERWRGHTSTRFTHVPAVSRDQLEVEYAQASTLVFPTLFEGLGLVAVEALAHGVPVICTDRGPNQVVQDGHNGRVVPAQDARALAAAIRELYHDPRALSRLRTNASEAAGVYDWSRYSNLAVAEVLNRFERSRAS